MSEEFSLGGLLSEAGSFAAVDAGIGALTGGGIPGSLIGGAVGFAQGALAYLISTFAAKTVEGWGASPETAKMVQRAVDLAVVGSSFGGLAKEGIAKGLGLELKEGTNLLEKVFKDPIERFAFMKPETTKLAIKAGSTALMTYYIVEPYYEDPEKGPMIPIGMAALAATGIVAANKLSWLGDWGYASLRRTLAENEWPILGSGKFLDVISHPELKAKEGVIPVLDKRFTVFDPLSFKGIMERGEKPVIFFERDFAKRANIETLGMVQPLAPLIEEVQKMGPQQWEEIGQFMHGLSEDFFAAPKPENRLAEELLNRGLLNEESAARVASAIMSYRGAMKQWAEALIEHAGPQSEQYIKKLSEGIFTPIQRAFLEVTSPEIAEKLAGKKFGTVTELSDYLKELGVSKEELRSLIDYGHNIPEEAEGITGVPSKYGYRQSKTTMLRGEWINRGGKKDRQITKKAIERAFGAKAEEVPIYNDLLEKRVRLEDILSPGTSVSVGGKEYVWMQHPKTGEYQWWRDTELGVKFREGKEGVRGSVATVNLAASLFEAVSESAKNMAFLSKMKWLQRAAEGAGKWVAEAEMAPAGYKKLEDWLAGKVRRPESIMRPFGVLSEGYVSEDVARVAHYYANMDNYVPKVKSLAKLNRWYKQAYLALNHKTWVNVYMGNVFLTTMNGLNPFKVQSEFYSHLLEQRGAKPMLAYGDKTIEELALTHGVNLQNVQRMQYDIKEMANNMKLLESAYDWDKSGSAFSRAIESVWNHTVKVSYKGYAGMHDMFRIGAFRLKLKEYMRAGGMTLDEAAMKAAQYVHQAYGIFDDMPVVVRHLRDTIWPFLGFHFRLFPQVVKAAVQYPERFMMTAALFEGLQRAAFKEQYGEDWERGYDYERLANLEYMKPHIGGIMGHFIKVPKMGPLPGGYIYAGFVPWNIPVATPIFNASGDAPDLQGLMSSIMLQSPIMRFISGMIHGTDPSTLSKVMEMAGPGRATASYLQYAFKTMAPAPFGINHWLGELLAKEGWFDPVVSWFNYYGTYPDGTPVGDTHMLYNMFLPTVMQYDPDYSLDMAMRRIDAVVAEHRKAYYRALYRNAPEPVIARNEDELLQIYDQAWEQKMNLVESFLGRD